MLVKILSLLATGTLAYVGCCLWLIGMDVHKGSGTRCRGISASCCSLAVVLWLIVLAIVWRVMK